MAKHFENPDIPSTGINKEWFQIIITEVQRLEKILRGLIDFTRHEDIRLEKVDPNRLIEDVLTIHKERFREKDLVLETNLGNQVGEILVDPNRFQQVIRNLVSNAIEASHQNGVIRIDTDIFVPSDKEQETGELNAEKYFEMKIQNGGRIIPPDELQKFFDPFYTTKEYGIGIGLTLVKRIVENHNGSISVKSDPSGTVFTLWLPVNPLEIEHGRSVAQEKVQAGS
jgi:signal transduction histidine kinase